MLTRKSVLKKLLLQVVFAVSFGLIEAAVVVYIREIFGFSKIYSPPTPPKILLNLGFIVFLANNPPILPNEFIAQIEAIREIATIILLLSFAAVAANRLKGRIGVFIFTFAIWDLAYYLFLRIFSGWPRTLADVDVFFLLPVPWVGPVIVPIVLFTLLVPIGASIYAKNG